MSDYKEQNQQCDSFSQYMQQQLKGYQLPPDESCWDEIGQRLKRRRNGLLLRRGLYIAGAAVLALLILISIPAEKDTPPNQPKRIEELAISDVKTEKPIDNQLIAIAETKPLRQLPAKVVASQNKPEETIEIIATSKTETETETEKRTEKKQEKKESAVDEKKKATELPASSGKQISLPHKAKQKRSWQIGAGLIAMGNYTSENGENLKHYAPEGQGHDLMNDGNGWIPSTPDYAIQLQPDNCDNISYNLPLSFGITARKQLGKRLSVETGLVYTYLSTNFRKDSPTLIKGKLGLHYLGVPVNLIVNLVGGSKWDVYASGGVMVEKGLRSIYTQQVYRANSYEKAIVKTSISGLQWSLNGSLGVSYQLQKDWSLYAEPRISYFFDNNQPISVRTDKPFTLGFGVGIRFDF